MSTEGNPPPWPSVQGAWAALAASAGPNDRVGLITFSDAATNRWNLKAVTTPEERAQLVAALPNQTGGGTNIGAALNSAVQMLSQGGSSEIQRVVFITDGINEPGADTVPADTSQGEWPQLIEEGKQLVASRDGQLSRVRLGSSRFRSDRRRAGSEGVSQRRGAGAAQRSVPGLPRRSGQRCGARTRPPGHHQGPRDDADHRRTQSRSQTHSRHAGPPDLHQPRKGLPTQVDRASP